MSLRASEMGLTESQFWGLSFSEYVWMWNGYTRRVERQSWEASREIVSIIYNTNVKKGKQKRAKKLIPLSIDPKIRVKTEQEVKEMFANIPKHWLSKKEDN